LFAGQTVTSDNDNDGLAALVEYALGGSSTNNDRGLLPIMDRTNGRLQLTAVVRTNDDLLIPEVQSSLSLSSTGEWSTNGINFTNHSETTNSVPEGFVRRTYWIEHGTNNRMFMRMRFTLNPTNQ
jgi:hypothetical protein